MKKPSLFLFLAFSLSLLNACGGGGGAPPPPAPAVTITASSNSIRGPVQTLLRVQPRPARAKAIGREPTLRVARNPSHRCRPGQSTTH